MFLNGVGEKTALKVSATVFLALFTHADSSIDHGDR